MRANDKKNRAGKARHAATRAGLCLALMVGPAYAQTVPDAGSLLREQQERQPERLPRPAPEVEEKIPAAPAPSSDAGIAIDVREIRFTGQADLLTAEERRELTAPLTGRPVALAELRDLAARVTALLHGKGNLLARAVLPPQDVTEGRVEIAILVGVLDAWEFSGLDDARVRESLVRGLAERAARPGEGLRAEALESALLRMNELPAVTARARLAPGVAVNSTRIIVDVSQEPLFAGQIWGDNFGNAGTGTAQANALLSMRDLTGHGEETRIQGTKSDGLGLVHGRIKAPLGASGWHAHAAYTYLDYHLVEGAGVAAGIGGNSHNLALGADYDIVRSRRFNLTASVIYDHVRLANDSTAGRLDDKRLDSGTAQVFGDWSDGWAGGGYTYWSGAWTWGDLDLSRIPGAAAADDAGLRTAGSFHRFHGRITRHQMLPARFTLWLNASGQWASKNLDSSQEFSLGGPYGVRAYPVNEGRGDAGWQATAELRYDLPVPALHSLVQLAGFFDAGHVWLNENPKGLPIPTATGRNSYGLAGVGAAIRWRHEHFSLSATWAHTVGDNPGRSIIDGSNVDGDRDSSRFWLQAAVSF